MATRYELRSLIGRGGMADVYAATDQTRGEVVALKRLREVDDDDRRRRSVELFEREFHVLSQLAHPRVVKVHDYGIEGTQPYYTMELLEGGDLHERTPIAWKAACAIARDVCSVLSLLHSRKLVYRDLSPRNVRLTHDGQAKVIDFGAMLPMGPTRQVVGTAAFCAPEAVQLQALDGRTDLYSLGATLYYVLSGRRAYPARDFRELREQWKQPPRRLTELSVSLPEALDALVMELLSLDPALRPSSAGEVMERLTAIASLPEDEQLLVSHAYLTTPTLVGRDRELARIRKKVSSAQRGRGGALLVRGASGSGRSRVLDATALEAKLAGATVLRADAVDAQSGDYGVVSALCAQLLEAQPEAAHAAALPHLPVLGHLLPALLEARPEVLLHNFADPNALRPALQGALRQWFAAVAQPRAVALVVDDFDRIDEPSAAFLALLAYEAPRCGLLVCASVRAESGMVSGALQLLADASAKVSLGLLNGMQTEVLLRSLFGDVPHLQLLATRLHRLAEGNPRDVLQLAQHLVDKGAVRYRAGAWSLPDKIDPSELPANMAQALDARVAALEPRQRELAQAMALCPELRLSLQECALLLGLGEHGKVLSALDALLRAEVVTLAGQHYVIAQEGFVAALRRVLEPALEAELQLRYAAVFEQRGERMRSAMALVRGGQEQRGLDLLVRAAEQSQIDTDRDTEIYQRLLRSLPTDWPRWFETGLALCAKYNRGARDTFVLKRRYTSLMSSLAGALYSEAYPPFLAELSHYAGLDIEAQLDPSLPRDVRLARMFERAQARYDALPEHERVLDPRSALAQLARTIVSALGSVSIGHDHALLRAIPSLAPFAAVSPMLEVVELLVVAVRTRLTARTDETRTAYQWQLDRLAQPDGAGLGASYRKYTRASVACGLALIEASAGRRECLTYAAELETDPMYTVNGWITRMLYHAWLGQMREADRCRQRVELLRIQNSPNQYLEGGHLLAEVAAYASASDLTRVKQRIDEVEGMARRYPGWQPMAHYARGEYQRLRGDLPNALAEFEAGLALTAAGKHAAWVHLAGGLMQTLAAMGCDEQAVARGEGFLAGVQGCGLGYLGNCVRLPLALSLSQLGRHEQAAVIADAAIDELTKLGTSGLHLGLAYETRARVAGRVQDEQAFERFAVLCAEQYQLSENRALTARYDRLVSEAKAAALVRDDRLEAADYSSTVSGTYASQITSLMEGARGPQERAQRCLELLIKRSSSVGGFLITMVDRDPTVVAQRDDGELPDPIERLVREYLQSEMQHTGLTEMETATQMGDPDGDRAAAWSVKSGATYRPVVLSHENDDGSHTIVGVVVLHVDATKTFIPPLELATDLSRFIHDSGDVSVIVTPDLPRALF